MANNERQFEDDVFALMTEELGWTARKNADFTRTVDKAMDLPVFVKFLKTSQPKAWARFEAAYEGAAKSKYTCKYCGQSAGSIQALVNGKCPRHPTGFAKGPHAPVR